MQIITSTGSAIERPLDRLARDERWTCEEHEFGRRLQSSLFQLDSGPRLSPCPSPHWALAKKLRSLCPPAPSAPSPCNLFIPAPPPLRSRLFSFKQVFLSLLLSSVTLSLQNGQHSFDRGCWQPLHSHFRSSCLVLSLERPQTHRTTCSPRSLVCEAVLQRPRRQWQGR